MTVAMASSFPTQHCERSWPHVKTPMVAENVFRAVHSAAGAGGVLSHQFSVWSTSLRTCTWKCPNIVVCNRAFAIAFTINAMCISTYASRRPDLIARHGAGIAWTV